MRILALVTDAFGGLGGIAQYNRDLLVALASMDSIEEVVVVPRVIAASRVLTPSKIRQKFAAKNRFLYVFQVFH